MPPPGKLALRLFAGVIVGVVLVFAVQIPVTRLWGLAGVHWSAANLPLAASQQFAALSTLFLAILGSTIGAALVARERAVAALLILVLLGMSIDGFAMFVRVGADLPLWFRIAFVGQIPLATLVGWALVRSRLPRPASAEEAA